MTVRYCLLASILFISMLMYVGFSNFLPLVLVFIIVASYLSSLSNRISQLETKIAKLLQEKNTSVLPSDKQPLSSTEQDVPEIPSGSMDLETEARLRAKGVTMVAQGARRMGAPIEPPTSTAALIRQPERSLSEEMYENAQTSRSDDATVGPSFFNWEKCYKYIFTGNPIAKIGVVVLFVGVIFLLSFVSKYLYFPISLRLIGVATAGIAMVLLGWRIHANRPLYASILEGGGIGLLYITTYMAFKVYALLSPITAFVLLLIIVAVSAANAVQHHAKSLAVISTIGGFLAPLLVSSSGGSLTFLYTYYLMLNIGVLGIAWFKTWPELNIVSFIFTFILTGLWGWYPLSVHDLYVVQCFLYTFFVFYILLAILYTARDADKRHPHFLSLIIFGTPIATFTIATGLVNGDTQALASHALVMAAIYALSATAMRWVKPPALTLLSEVYFALAILFATLSVPLFSMHISSTLIWAVEGLILMYVGIRLDRLVLRLFAALIQLATGVLFLMQLFWRDMGLVAITSNELYLSAAVIGFVGIITASIWKDALQRIKNPNEDDIAKFLLLWGFIWFYIDAFCYLNQHVIGYPVMMIYTLFIAITSALFWLLSECYQWQWLRNYAFLLLPVMISSQIDATFSHYPFAMFNLFIWVVSFTVLYLMLYRADRLQDRCSSSIHLVSALLLTYVVAYLLDRALGLHYQWAYAWHVAIWGMVTAGMVHLFSIPRIAGYWPLRLHQPLYQYHTSSVLVFFGILWFLFTLFLSGNAAPVVYLPLLNPLDIAIGCSLLVGFTWCWHHQQALARDIEGSTANFIIALYSSLGFMWLNAMILRTVHHWAHIPYTFDALWYSPIAQTSISISWTLISLIATFIAARRHMRWLWFGGFALIVLIVLKLFFVDLSHVGTMARVITFVTVGILLLINGYISPMPPRDDADKIE